MALTDLDQLPKSLQTRAYHAAGEIAWPRPEALQVIDYLTAQGTAVLGVEIWLPTSPGPTIPTPIIYNWEAEARQESEAWTQFAERVNQLAKEYVDSFEWDEEDVSHKSLTPYFNLTLCQEREYAELSSPLVEG